MKLFKIIYKDSENVYQEFKVSESKRSLTKVLADVYSIKSENILLVEDITKEIIINKADFICEIEKKLIDNIDKNAIRQQGIIKRCFLDNNFKVIELSSKELASKFNISDSYFKRCLHTWY